MRNGKRFCLRARVLSERRWLKDTMMMQERRKEERYPLAEIYREYFQLKIKSGNDYLQVGLVEFSRHGVRFQSPVCFSVGSTVECVLSIPRSLSNRAYFKVIIRHCGQQRGLFIAGAEIETVFNETWLRVFERVHDYIIERAGEVY